MNQRRPARFGQGVVAVSLIAYALFSTGTSFALHGITTSPNRELYPFFTWSLFSKADNQKIDYSVFVTSINDEQFEAPIDWRKVEELPSFHDSRSLGLKAARAVGSKTRAGAPNADALRRTFENRYFGNHDVDYIIIRSVYNPMLLWRDGAKPDEEQVIGSFSYRGRS